MVQDQQNRAIILAFDDTVAESIAIKVEIFRNTFSFAPEHLEEIVAYHLENSGMSHDDKFRHYLR